MSNKTQLQTNNTALDALITRINAAKDTAASLPDASGGAGASIKTCTINISGHYSQMDNVVYTAYFNDSFESVLGNGSATLENVVCGSMVVFPGNYILMTCSDGELVYNSGRAVFYKAPVTGGVIASVTLTQD